MMSQELLSHKTKCRLCFQRISGTRNTTIGDTVKQKFFRLTNVELKSSDNFSNSVCKACSKSLDESSEFQQKMIENQLRLYAFEGDNKQIVKEEPTESNTIQLQEIMFEELIPKTEVFDDSWVKDQSPEFQEFEEAASPASPDDNDGVPTPPNEVEDNCNQVSEIKVEPSTVNKRKRRRTKYEPEQFLNAVEAVALGELSAYAASKVFGVPKCAISKRLHDDQEFLTDQEELQVKLYVNKRTEAGIPSSDDDIEKFVMLQLLSKRRAKDCVRVKKLSSTWVSTFRKRHFDVKVPTKQLYGEFSCDICGFLVREKRNILDHMRLHAPTDQVNKPPKKKIKRNPNYSVAFENAKKSVEAGMPMRKAAILHGIPNSTLSQYFRQVAKEKSGQEPEIFKCSFCEKVFTAKTNRRMHEVASHLTPVGEFPCEVCGRVYSTHAKLKNHNYLAHEKRCFPCIECSEVFDDSYKLQCHRSTHREEVACHVCGKLVPEGKNMTSHMKSHAPRDQFKCTFEGCSKAFPGMQGLKYHIKNTHEQNLNIKCPKCSSTFPNKERLKIHAKRSHAAPKFFCEVDGCSYKNTRKDYLKLHLRNHKDIDVKFRDELIASLANKTI